MKVAIVGSRGADRAAEKLILRYLPADTTEIVSGGADGVDALAAELAQLLGVPLKEFLPDYATYGRRAPLVRNDAIVAYADEVLAFWDGESRGTANVIAQCIKKGRSVRVVPLTGGVADGCADR